MKRKIAAILAADIAGYSRLVAEDEEETLGRLESWRAVFDDFVLRSSGRIFSRAGDAIMAEFASAVDATRCAIDIQESMRTRNLAFPQHRRMEFRIGITIGDVVERDGDLLGDGVNIAARLESLAEPGGICVSRTVYEAVANKLSVPFHDIGRQEVKNIPQPVHAFRVEWKGPARRGAAYPPRQRRWLSALATAGAGALAIAAAAGGYFLLRSTFQPPAPTAPVIATPEHPAAGDQIAQTQPPTPTPPVAPPPTNSPTPPVASSDQPTAPADLSEALALLARQGGIVQKPATAPEFYHNARSYESRGDALAARQAYLGFAQLDLDFIDPLLRFAALLRVQEGRAGAREVFAALAERNKAPAFQLVHALQFDGPERLRRLMAFIAARPDYAPASALLAEEYSDDRLGAAQTLADVRQEHAALQRFLESDLKGSAQRFFLDHSVVAAWTDRARKRLSIVDQMLESRMQQPGVTFMRHNTGWNVSVQLPEAATSFAWRIVGDGDFRATGATTALDSRTGKPAPVTWFELPGDVEQAQIEVRYQDASGRLTGPFPINFEWRKAIADSQKQILEQFSSAWVQYRKGPSDLLYFTHLVSYRCAIRKAEFGFDDEGLARQLPLPACDRRDPLSVPLDAQTYLRVPPAAKSVSVRLTYSDGSQSPVAIYKRPTS